MASDAYLPSITVECFFYIWLDIQFNKIVLTFELYFKTHNLKNFTFINKRIFYPPEEESRLAISWYFEALSPKTDSPGQESPFAAETLQVLSWPSDGPLHFARLDFPSQIDVSCIYFSSWLPGFRIWTARSQLVHDTFVLSSWWSSARETHVSSNQVGHLRVTYTCRKWSHEGERIWIWRL